MNEKSFQTEFGRSVRLIFPLSFYYKIPDSPYSPNIIRRPIEKPFDCFMVLENILYAFELKMHKIATAFAFNKVEDHQKRELLKVANNGFPAYVLINVRTKLTEQEKLHFSLDKTTINYIYYISIADYLKLEAESSRKSIPFQFFVDEMNGEHCISRIRLPDKTM